MKIVFAFLSSLLIFIFIPSCKQKIKDEEQYPKTSFFDPFEFSKANSLLISARFSECGEWSGHKEEIIIDADKNGNFHAHYKVYPYNCDSLKYYYANENLKPKFDKTIELNDKRKQSIIDYIKRLTQSKITEQFPRHAGNIFSIIKSDSTLIINVYDRKQYDVDSYNKLVTELFK
jgi:hypothetical protein